jgi:hypothetical protein
LRFFTYGVTSRWNTSSKNRISSLSGSPLSLTRTPFLMVHPCLVEELAGLDENVPVLPEPSLLAGT